MTSPVTGPVVVDTSALAAIITDEPTSEALTDHLGAASELVLTTATLVELGIVVEARLGPVGADIVGRLIRDAEIRVVPVDADLAERALSAWRRFGKGRHAAGLNYGDCFSYALADRLGAPLLCIGEDFSETDIQTA